MERKIVERLRAGSGVNQICRELSISKRRVVMVRAKAEEAGYFNEGTELPAYPEAIFPDVVDGRADRGSTAWKELSLHLAWITERLDGGWHAITVYEELPIKVPRSSFYRFLIRHRLNERGLALRRVVPEIVHLPGEALLIDWGYLWKIEQGGLRIKLWAFIGILGYSRFMVVRLMISCDSAHTLAELGSMYQEIGGVPVRTTSDNPKVFAEKADRYEPILNPLYERFASHYGTIIECLPPRSPTQKGKVERPVPYVRRLLEAYSGDRNDVAAIQLYLDKKLVIANARRHGTTNERPVDRFKNEEQPVLKPLPALAYEVAEYHEGTVRKDGHVRFAGKYYSVCEDYINKPVSIIGTSLKVAIYQAGKLIETHERVTDRARSKSTKRHHLKPWEQVCNNPDGLLSLGTKIGPSVEALIRRVLLDGDGFINYRRIWGILALDKKYTQEEVNSACDEALETEVYSSVAIEKFILRVREEGQEVNPSPVRPVGKFQRDITEYTQLLLNLGKPLGETYEH